MITMRARPRQTDGRTDEHHDNSATIRALKRKLKQKFMDRLLVLDSYTVLLNVHIVNVFL